MANGVTSSQKHFTTTDDWNTLETGKLVYSLQAHAWDTLETGKLVHSPRAHENKFTRLPSFDDGSFRCARATSTCSRFVSRPGLAASFRAPSALCALWHCLCQLRWLSNQHGFKNFRHPFKTGLTKRFKIIRVLCLKCTSRKSLTALPESVHGSWVGAHKWSPGFVSRPGLAYFGSAPCAYSLCPSTKAQTSWP